MTVDTHRKGWLWRRKVQVELEAAGLDTRCRGIGEAGDDITVAGCPPLSVETKNERRHELSLWLDQAERQAPRGSVPLVWAHRRGKHSALDGYVILSGRAFLRLLAAGRR